MKLLLKIVAILGLAVGAYWAFTSGHRTEVGIIAFLFVTVIAGMSRTDAQRDDDDFYYYYNNRSGKPDRYGRDD